MTEQVRDVNEHEKITLDPITGMPQYVSAGSDERGQRYVPYHRIGEVLDETLTKDEMMERAGHTYEVVTVPLDIPKYGDFKTLESASSGNQLIYKVWEEHETAQHIGTIGPDYKPTQLEWLYDLCESTVDSSEAIWAYAGDMDKGRKSFAALEFPEGLQIGPDAYKEYLLFTTGHDGSMATQINRTQMRIACHNMIDSARSFTIRHSGDVQTKLIEVREALEISFVDREAFIVEANELLEKDFTNEQFLEIVSDMYPLIDEDKVTHRTERGQKIAAENRKRTHKQHWHLWLQTDTTESIRGTAWGAYQTFVEWADWIRPVKGKDDDDRAVKRAEQSIAPSSSASAIKADALGRVKVLAGVG